MKACKKCGEVKPLSSFHKASGCKDGHRGTCKACHYIAGLKWKKENKDKHNLATRKSYLKLKYGVTLEWYESKLREQKGVCAICSCDSSELRGKDAMFCVDHCHHTGQPRALLCHKCNAGIGMLKDDPILVARAWTYLQQNTLIQKHT
jgi:hypothetical protein